MFNIFRELNKVSGNALSRAFVEDPLITSLIVIIFVSILIILFVSKLPINKDTRDLCIKFLIGVIIVLFMLILLKFILVLLGDFPPLDKGIDRIHIKETNLLANNQESCAKETKGNKMT